MKTKSCAGCMALEHIHGGGFHCISSMPFEHTEYEVWDRRRDNYISQKPIGDCKVKTLTEMVNRDLKK